MKRLTLGLALLILGTSVVAAEPRPGGATQETDLRAKLIGTWRSVSAKYDGQEHEPPENVVTYKHVTPTGFVWLSYEKDSGKIFRAGGGKYTLKGDSYAERVEYGAGDDFDAVKNAEHTFNCKIEGDRWFHTGKLAGGTTIEEVWERVKPE
jgi:hypothetical protein